MEKNEEWDKLISNLLFCSLSQRQATKEYEYLRKREEEIDEYLTTNLSTDQKQMVDEILFELSTATKHEEEIIYREGIKDCVWILKNLGVLT